MSIVTNPKNRKLQFYCKICQGKVNPNNITKGHEKCIEYDYEGSSLEIDYWIMPK